MMFDHIFGGNRPTTEESAAAAFSALRDSRRDIDSRMYALATVKPRLLVTTAIQSAEQSVDHMRLIRRKVRGQFKRLAEQKTKATIELRRFKIEHGVVGNAAIPDPLNTIIIAQAFIIGEGLLTAGLMIGDGKMGIAAGLIYGLSVAFINITTGVVTGFLPARYVAYKLNSPAPNPHDKHIRAFAWFGMGAFIIALGTLHFAAARVRATGSHSGIFDFTEVGFAATFNDYYAIAIVVVGAIGSVLAIFKGYNGISDPVPGYTQARLEAEQKVDRTAQDLRDRIIEQLETIFLSASQKYEDVEAAQDRQLAEYEQRYSEVNDAILEHNNKVSFEKDRLRVLIAEKRTAAAYVEQKPSEQAPLNLDAFDALFIEEINQYREEVRPRLEHDTPPYDVLNRLQFHYDKALSAVLNAHAAFAAHAPEYDLNTDKE